MNNLRGLQEQFLRNTLVAARSRVKAYQEIRIPEGNLFSFLRTLPILSKRDLLEMPDRYVPNLGLKRLWTPKGMTSGTTGTPLTTLRSLDSIIWESAFIRRHWRWSGYTGSLRRATLRGDSVVHPGATSAPFWFHNRAENQLLLSSRHLRTPYIESIVDELEAFAPYLLQAYPSTAFEIASHLERTDRFLSIPFIFTGSEMLYPYQRVLISARLNAKVMDHYGMAERVAFATECQSGNYHINPEYSYVEIVDDNGEPTRDVGYVVGTTFHNLTMPLIRYRLSDRTRWKDGPCSCGRTYPMIEPIEGKFEDVIYGSNGQPISPSIITFAFKGLRNIERSQVAQVADNHWEIRVVPSPGFGNAERTAVTRNIHELVDPGVEITVIECQHIPRTAAGKYRWVVNEWTTRE